MAQIMAAAMVLMAAAMVTSVSATGDPMTLVVTAKTQVFQQASRLFQVGDDIGPMNPHDYYPNDHVTQDIVFEGLVEWDKTRSTGVDGISNTIDDFVGPALAIGWSSYSVGSSHRIDFTLRPGVTFHDGSAWDAAACKANFDQIMGGTGALGGTKALRGVHDWLGFTQSLDGWEIVDSMTFRITFSTYYANALRELTYVRPFRMVSVASLPSLANMEVSYDQWRNGAPRVFGGYTARGVSAPIGTGPYKVVDKLLVTASGTISRRLPAADFNASCTNNQCTYNTGELVSEVLLHGLTQCMQSPLHARVRSSHCHVCTVFGAGALHEACGPLEECELR